jgi:uncharacterized Zn-finger protein
MSDIVEFSISIPSDDDGFISRQCPHCGYQFKITIMDIENEEILELFCPYCGLPSDVSETHPDELIEQAYITATNYAYSIIDNVFKDLENKANNKFFEFKRVEPISQEDDKVLFEKEEMEMFDLKCCTKKIKANDSIGIAGIYCPFCGVK